MTDLMHTLLTITLAGSALAVVLALVGRLTRDKLPKAAIYYLWLLVLLRLCLPWAVFGEGVDLPQPELPQKIQVTVPTDIDPEAIQNIQGDPISAPEGMEKYTVATGALSRPWYTTAWRWVCDNFVSLWLGGAAIHFLWFAASYLRFRRSLEKACTPLTGPEQALLLELNGGKAVRACRSPLAQTPMVVGLARPAIFLPETELTARQLEHILRHELTHLHACDLWIKWAAVLVTSFHWFNPLMPWLRREMNRWCELSCDERVVRAMDDQQKEDYGRTLLALAAAHALPRAVPATMLVEEKGRLKERLTAILTFKQATGAVLALCCAVAVLFTGCAGLLGPAQKQSEYLSAEKPNYTPPAWVEMADTFVTTLSDEQLALAVELIGRWQTENAPDLTEATLRLLPITSMVEANAYVMSSQALYCVDAGAGEIKPFVGALEERYGGLAYLSGTEGKYRRDYCFYLSRNGQMSSLKADVRNLKNLIKDATWVYSETAVQEMQLQLRNGALEYAEISFVDAEDSYHTFFYNGPAGVRNVREYPDRTGERSPVKLEDLSGLIDALIAWQQEHDTENGESYNASYSRSGRLLENYGEGSAGEFLGIVQYSLSTGKITRVEGPDKADSSGGVITLLYPAVQPGWLYAIGE